MSMSRKHYEALAGALAPLKRPRRWAGSLSRLRKSSERPPLRSSLTGSSQPVSSPTSLTQGNPKMARPRKAIRPVEKTISLPEDLVAKVELELYSDVEGKVPFGAWQRYLERLIRADLEQRMTDNLLGSSPEEGGTNV